MHRTKKLCAFSVYVILATSSSCVDPTYAGRKAAGALEDLKIPEVDPPACSQT
jgi:hypothetical protein